MGFPLLTTKFSLIFSQGLKPNLLQRETSNVRSNLGSLICGCKPGLKDHRKVKTLSNQIHKGKRIGTHHKIIIGNSQKMTELADCSVSAYSSFAALPYDSNVG